MIVQGIIALLISLGRQAIPPIPNDTNLYRLRQIYTDLYRFSRRLWTPLCEGAHLESSWIGEACLLLCGIGSKYENTDLYCCERV